jgi:MurNAc alpha-1-phosphate uridylyltransferase
LIRILGSFESDRVLQKKIGHVNVDNKIINSPLFEKFPKNNFVYEVNDFANIDVYTIERLKTLKSSGYRFSVGDIEYSDEQEEGGLESAGGIVKALPLMGDDTFLVVNGDVFTDYDFQDNRRLAKGVLAHLILVPNPEHNPEGDFALDGNLVVDNKQYTFSGIGYYSPKLFESVPYGKSSLAPLLRAAMREGKVTGELYEGEWLDIGTPERLERLNAELMNRY